MKGVEVKVEEIVCINRMCLLGNKMVFFYDVYEKGWMWLFQTQKKTLLLAGTGFCIDLLCQRENSEV